MHHHVALAALEVGHCEFWIVDTSLREARESSIDSFSLLFLRHFVLVGAFTTLSLLDLFHVLLTLLIV